MDKSFQYVDISNKENSYWKQKFDKKAVPHEL